jgi:hypothetical protein
VFVHPTKDDFLAWLRVEQKEYKPPQGGAPKAAAE